MATPATTSGRRPGAPPRADTPGTSAWSVFQNVIIIWALSQIFTKFVLVPYLLPNSSTDSAIADTDDKGPSRTLIPEKLVAQPIWPLGTELAIDIYISSSSESSDLFSKPRGPSSETTTLAHLTWEKVTWGDWNIEKSWTGTVDLPISVRNNASSIWAFIFLTANGASHNPYNAMYYPGHIHLIRKQLTKYNPHKKIIREKKLLSSEGEEEVEEQIIDNGLWMPYWHQNLTLALISDTTALSISELPPQVVEHVHVVPGDRHPSGIPQYYPIVYPNTFWQLSSHWEPYTAANTSLPLHIDFHALSWRKFQIYSSLSAGFDQAAAQQGAGAASELDEIKRMLLETNPILLIVTAMVSVLHMVFEMLAFTADVSHWRKKSELTGISVRTIFTNVFVQIIILLYLLDNNEDTSWMILFGQGTGAAIEAWKVTKVLDIRLLRSGPGARLPYQLVITDKHVLTEDEKRTQEYDRLAFRYVSYAAAPLLFAYTIYSLMYQSHKGWYSFTIRTLTSFVYTFGFAQLVPQLIINYKLKSVAHLPTKAFVYKFLGTIVDDFFAFCIKMPLLHRLACFRDDVVFVIFLYQRWIYRIDPKRVNEFGQVMNPESEGHSAEGEDAAVVESKKDK